MRYRLPCTAMMLALVLTSAAKADELLWSTAHSNWTTIESYIWSSPAENLEAADDFDVVGTISRVVVAGDNSCLTQCYNVPPVNGVYVRFYEWTTGGPGALQSEQFLAGDDPRFIHDPTGPDQFDITLPTPFQATGRHFISVQPEFNGSFYWAIWVGNHGNPAMSTVHVRDNQAGGTWAPAEDLWGNLYNDDLDIALYGPSDAGPQYVNSCGEWVVYETPEPQDAYHAILRDVSVLSPVNAWAVGEFSKYVQGSPDTFTLAMHWNGAEWTVIPSPSPTACPTCTYATFDAVAAVAPDDVWAAGGKRIQAPDGFVGTHILVARWDGQSWTVMDTVVTTGASGSNVRDIEVVGPDDIWFFGDFIDAPGGTGTQPGLAMHWDGSDFEMRNIGAVGGGGLGVEAGSALAGDDIWAVGGGGDGDWSGFSNIFHWDGTGWQHVPGPTPGYFHRLFAVHAFASDDVWAAGQFQDENGIQALMLHWDGSSWTQFSSPAGGATLVTFAPDDLLSLGSGGVAHWNGVAWTQEPSVDGPLSPSLLAADIIGPCNFWAVGRESVGGNLLSLAAQVVFSNTPAGDADGDGVDDASDNCPDHYNPEKEDCDGNGSGDVCEIIAGTSVDCNGNATPDACESFQDCNANAIPDECEIDCQGNGIPDDCDIAGGASADCDGNGVPDECQVISDCNTNGISDQCDIDGGTSTDYNASGVPDECEALGEGTITVNTVNDTVDFSGAQQVDDLPGADGKISFREAVTAANNTAGAQTIAFNIPVSEWWLMSDRAILRLEDGLFNLTDDGTIVDFTSQTRFTGDTNPNGYEVGIYGLQPNAWGVTAILVSADHCVIKGLDRVMQRGHGVQIRGNNNRVIDCTISGPLYSGVYITGGFDGPTPTGNVVGGSRPGEGNVLSAGNDGVRIDAPAAGNIVIGNVLTGSYSGVNVRGSIYTTTADNNRIGGPTPGERNIISDAGHYGEEGFPTGTQVNIEYANGTIVEGNYIGTTADGSASAGQIGPIGVRLLEADGTVIRGNLISGIAVNGVNHAAGQRFGTAVTVYGTSDGTVITGNLIGTDASGENPITTRSGISLSSWPGSGAPTNTTIGGLDVGDSNTIAFTELTGISAGSVVTGGTFSANGIHSNGGLGISLTGGANGGQAAPQLGAAVSTGSSVTIDGSLTSTANASHRIEFFANGACDPSGSGEGERFIGSIDVTTDASGTAGFSANLSAAVTSDEVVTATATALATGSTSEFSMCLAVEVEETRGDVDGDGDVDLDDYSAFADCLMGPAAATFPQCAASDMDQDGDTDLVDFATMQALFGE